VRPAPARPGGVSRRRRRPVLLLLAAGILAAAGTGVGVKLATGTSVGSNPPTGQRHAVSPASSTAASRASAATRSPFPVDTTPPVAPANVTATAVDEYTVQVAWTDHGSGITGFNVTNGCGTDGCSGGALNVRTGLVTKAEVRTTPGAYQCFAVQALSPSGVTASARMACTTTPGIDVPVTRQWTDTGVTVQSGAYVGISASGDAYVAAGGSSEPPGGNPACMPEKAYSADSGRFPASQLPCWSLIARIGNNPPFEVGTSILIPATSGRLYLGVNSPSVAGDAGAWAVKIKIGGLP
jgi:hypothetical protein